MTEWLTTRRKVGIGLAVLLFVVMSASGSLANYWVDLAWFRDMGHESVFWTRLLSRVGVGAAGWLVAFAVLVLNGLVARRMRPASMAEVAGADTVADPGEAIERALGQARRFLEPYAGRALAAAAALIAWGQGAALSRSWSWLRLAATGQRFGVLDPQFGLDAGFFTFVLPALRVVSDWVWELLFVTLLFTAAVHFLDGAIRIGAGWRDAFDDHVKAHLSVLMGLLVVSKALDYWMRIYELDWSPRGQVTGASYTDVHAQIPAYLILIVIAVVSGVVLMVNIRIRGWRLPAIALGVWVGASLIVGGIYPALVQQLTVTPNELAAEKPYIERNIAGTRRAFDLDVIEGRSFAAANDLTARDLVEATATIANIRMWDPNIVSDSYRQLQGIRLYYDFKDVDVDRYTIDGKFREVLVCARELNVDQLAEQAQTWVNRHLVYTHGYGIVMSPVNATSSDGGPQLLIRDIPPRTSTDLTVTQPALYYGEDTRNYVIVDTTQKEFDYPSGSGNVMTEYAGKNGVSVGGLFERMMFAILYGDSEILFSTAIRPSSRVLYHREVRERVLTLAPWLDLDSDPYVVLTREGRLVWVLDGFTTSQHYPYSQRQDDGVNYIRNSVKATVDAYDGTTRIYAFDESDPVLAAWMKVFPGLVSPRSEIPADVVAHLRYPEDLFTRQARAYETYHMLDPQVFYNKEDQWSVPGEAKGAPMAPYYVLMALPGETRQSFLLMQPYTPRNKDNMIAWMAASSDAVDYGRRVVFQFPKQKLILGPEQVKARLNQEPDISSKLTLLNQQGSAVRYGNLLVIPIRDSVVYVQPLYIQAQQSPMPELKYVVVAYADRVVMSLDLATALTQVFGAAPSTAGEATPGGSSEGTATAGAPGGGAPGGASQDGDARLARDLYERALRAQRAGDWAAYGRLVTQLGEVLVRMAAQEGTRTR